MSFYLRPSSALHPPSSSACRSSRCQSPPHPYSFPFSNFHHHPCFLSTPNASGLSLEHADCSSIEPHIQSRASPRQDEVVLHMRTRKVFMSSSGAAFRLRTPSLPSNAHAPAASLSAIYCHAYLQAFCRCNKGLGTEN